MRKTPLEIINETAEFYISDPSRRSLTNLKHSESDLFDCVYVSTNGNNCAFSRCCTDEGKQKLHNEYEGKSVLSLHEPIDFFLKEEYKGLSNGFWNLIQTFHDNKHYWNDDGITEEGKQYLDKIRNEYSKQISDLERSKGRSEDYYQLSSEEQWMEDKKLGILDWDGKE